MQQPTWKKILSYFHEFHIESTGSDINLALNLTYSRGRYQLSTQNAIYSFGDLYINFYQAFQHIDLANRQVENILILGFGLGSIPFMLEKKFKKKYRYVGVEIDEEVIYLAEKYVLDELAAPTEIICADAGIFVEVCQEKFDIICVDLFLDDVIPDEFEQQQFLENVKELLHPDGMLLYNRLSFTEEDKEDSELFFQEAFLPVFPNGKHIDIDGNWIFLNK